MTTQKEWLEKALKLANENPEAEIVVCADSSELLEEYGWTIHQITSVELEYQHTNEDGEITVGLDEIKDKMDYGNDNDSPETTDEEAIKVSKQVIAIYTGA